MPPQAVHRLAHPGAGQQVQRHHRRRRLEPGDGVPDLGGNENIEEIYLIIKIPFKN
jgi:hypothetical protein